MRGHTQKPTYHCRDCGWKRATPPSEDVRIKGVTWFRTCPECRSTALECDNAGTLDALWDSLPEAWRIAPRSKKFPCNLRYA